MTRNWTDSPRYSQSAHNDLPQSRLMVVRRGTHLAFYSHPDAARVR